MFTNTQQSIITGSLLGDGHLSHRGKNSALVKKQCGANLEYLQWHETMFPGLCTPIRTYQVNLKGKTYTQHFFRLKACPDLTALRHEWYPSGIKLVPANLRLDPLSVAIWFSDDGSNVLSSRLAAFHTNSFTNDDVDRLAELMHSQFGIQCHRSNRNVLNVRRESYQDFIELVKPHIPWKCFTHKLQYRDSLIQPITLNQTEKMVSMYNAGHTIEEIEVSIGISRSSVSRVLNKNRKLLANVSTNNLPLDNTSGIRGISYDNARGKWIASAKVNGKRKQVRFNTKEEAINYRLSAQLPSTSCS